ncbi:jg7973 [Pararge aegeria aegeria]|uniref:Jg7973 protein n=1 Tax=Pararge aegeria aegeria TaxID=348720 RepID=A0A8S4QG19_9NEOP|nr:jg7973 [Pararge aegeria aegeria]
MLIRNRLGAAQALDREAADYDAALEDCGPALDGAGSTRASGAGGRRPHTLSAATLFAVTLTCALIRVTGAWLCGAHAPARSS